MAPHFPFLYDENGKEIKGADINNKEKSYLPYLKYTNKITLNYIKSIKQIHSKPPVIIITGDHGIRDKDNIESYFSTFTAYYNPELKYDHIKNSKSLINFFINKRTICSLIFYIIFKHASLFHNIVRSFDRRSGCLIVCT